jgi:hypothetical protein
MRPGTWAIALALIAAPAAAAAPATPLFASDAPLRLTIKAPIATLGADRSGNAHAGTISVAGTPDVHPIALSARGITRRMSDTCQFPPLRLDFSGRVGAGSLFTGQNRLKLVTHCRREAGFQQKVLLEYAAYRLFNVLTPLSFRARLATIDYVDEGGRPIITRVGFFIEDDRDVATRNGLVKATSPDRVQLARIEPAAGARLALFNYMIGNLDWSMRAGSVGEGCCHNSRLLAASKAPDAIALPIPYDFDFSGLVDAPYAAPPEGFKIRSVRERAYRGYCAHSAAARTAAAEMLARRPALLAEIDRIPGLEERTRSRAKTYLEGFFRDAAAGRMLADCIG